MKFRHLFFALLFALLVACSSETNNKVDSIVLDGSSEESFNQSLDELSEHMTTLEKDEFSEALLEVMLHEINRLDSEFANSESEMQELPSMYEPLDGYTAKEVIEKAESIRSKQK